MCIFTSSVKPKVTLGQQMALIEVAQRAAVVAEARPGSARRTTTAPTSRALASIAACCWCACLSTPGCVRHSIRGPIRRIGICTAVRNVISALYSIARWEVGAPQPGDVMVLRFGRCYSHGGIVTRPRRLTIVHAYHPARRVIEEEVSRSGPLSEPARKPRFFSYLAGNMRYASGLEGGQLFKGAQGRNINARRQSDAGLYRAANSDSGQHAADSDRVGASKLAPNIVWYNEFVTNYAATAAAREACSAAAGRRRHTARP